MELSVKNHGMFCVQAKATKTALIFQQQILNTKEFVEKGKLEGRQ